MRSIALVAALVASACAKIIVVTVGGNTTTDAGAVFEPQQVTANQGDVVYFNFTQGNHTVIQSAFPAPCIPAHDFNETLNGFNSGFRDTVNGTAVTNLQVVVDNPNTTIWFFDWATCAQGGVGAVNVNQSSSETFDGFVRNAQRLNGTDTTSTDSTSSSASSIQTGSSPSHTATSAATRAVVYGVSAVVPALAMLAALSL